jgi:putative membrane protein
MSKLSLFVCSCLVAMPLLAQKAEKAEKALTPQEFVDFAAQTDMTEAHLGQLAQDKGDAQGVKDFGKMLETDHTNDYNQVTAVATKAGLTVPKGLDAKHWEMVAPFEKLKGTAFDHKFVHTMVAGHEAAVAAYNKASRDLDNADLKAYAQQVLPVLQKHLDDAKALEKSHTK